MTPVDAATIECEETDREEATFRRKRLGTAAGSEDLGCSLYELPPGGRSWPYHFHTGNEEAIYVLSGTGELRSPDGTHRLSAGDYVALPTGGDGAHRVSNDGDEPLRYLMISTMRDPDVTVYPDSGKIGVFGGASPGGTGDRSVHGYFQLHDAVDYWADE